MRAPGWAKTSLACIAALVTTSILLPAANATPVTFAGTLAGTNENPSNASPGTGSVAVILDAAANTIRVEVTFSGLTSPTTASHIHCCEATPGANLNVMVATTTPSFTGFPLGVTSGTYDHTFDLTLASSYNPAFITSAFDPTHDVAGAESALIHGIESDETYLNVHTMAFPSGEVRTALLVPEPASIAIFGGGLAAFTVIRRRRKRITA